MRELLSYYTVLFKTHPTMNIVVNNLKITFLEVWDIQFYREVLKVALTVDMNSNNALKDNQGVYRRLLKQKS